MSGDHGPPSGTPGPRTPSWARRSAPRNPSFSDTTTSPPDSPGRSDHGRDYGGRQGRNDFGTRDHQYERRSDQNFHGEHSQAYVAPAYENPGYTVETPGGGIAGASPYPPAYFVQTPAHSDLGGTEGTPFSSAPSSPPHYGQSEDSKSARNFKVTNPLKTPRPAQPLHTMTKIDDDEEDYPDIEMVLRRKRGRCVRCLWIFLVLVVLVIGVGGLVVWLKFKPSKPLYTLEHVAIYQFRVQTAAVDAYGLNTNTVFANMTIIFRAHNRNKRYKISYQGGAVNAIYSSRPFMSGEVPQFEQAANGTSLFATSLNAVNAPLYGAGPYLLDDVKARNVTLVLKAHFKSHVSVGWKIITSTYRRYFDCTVSFHPITLKITKALCVDESRSDRDISFT